MKYRLVSLGKLKPGVDEQEALQKLMKLTKLPDLTVRKKLLAGKKTSLLTSEDVNRIAATKGKFTSVGLMVEVVEVAQPAETLPTKAPKTPKKGGSLPKRIGLVLASLVVVAFGLMGGLWYWLYLTPQASTAEIEAALINDQTAAVINIDLAQMNKLDKLLRLNLNDMLASGETDSVLDEMLALNADSTVSIAQVYVTVLSKGESAPVDVVGVVNGQFSSSIFSNLLNRYFTVEDQDAGVISLVKKAVVSEFQCPTDEVVEQTPVFAKLSNGRIVFSTSESAIIEFESRLSSTAAPSAKLARWQEFKKRKLTSVMIFSPQDSSQALPGLLGMIGTQVVKGFPQLTSFAFSSKVDLQNQGVRFDASLFSADQAWNSELANQANTWLQSTKGDTRVTSKTTAALLEPLAFNATAQSMDVSWPVNRAMISELRHSVENAIASAFGGSFSMTNSDEEQIDESPLDYSRVINLSQLPDFEERSYFGTPVLKDGAFVFDVSELRMNEQGFLNMSVVANAMIPKLENEQGLTELFRYSMTVSDVINRQGQSMLRDERCVDATSVFGRKNHEPQTNGSVFVQRANTTKQVRLAQGSQVSEINQVLGEYSLKYPIGVERFRVPMAAGESVEFAGVTFEILSLSDRGVKYKLSGDLDRFMEIRALNAEGNVLRRNFSSAVGKVRDQKFRGNVAAIEVYIAQGFSETSKSFTMENIFSPSGEDETAAHPFTLSYTGVDRAKWNRYQFVDMRLVRPEPEKWRPGQEAKRAIAEKTWPGVKLFVTHDPASWNANPTAHVYLPLWIELYASMSSLSYQLEGEGTDEVFVPVRFPYQFNDGYTLVGSQKVREQSFGLVNFPFNANYEENEPFGGLKGVITLRLPQTLAEEDKPFNDLWFAKRVEGVDVTLERVTRGNFPGYNFKLAGDLSDLIAVHGVNEYGQPVEPTSVQFNNGAWYVTLPFRDNLNTLRIVTAREQDEFELAFDF